jgi:hypothetical protein
MFCRYILAPLAALLVVKGLLGSAAAQGRGDWDRGARDWGARGRDRDRDRDGDHGQRNGEQSEWVLLGTTRVGGVGIDRDVIEVGRRDGRFARIGLQAADAPVFVLGVTVVFGDDAVQQIDLRQKLNPGERTQPLDLQGRARPIKRIEIAARAGHDFHRRGTLGVYAEQVRERENWELLGQQTVGFGIDRDVIRVGRREDRFEKIALEVSGNDIELLDVRVNYRHGPPQDISVREFIRAGGRTRPLDLIGGDRTIDRIELVYRSRPGSRGQATVAVYGLQGAWAPPPGPPPPPPPPPVARWEELGCQKASFGADHDTVNVGRQEGRFSAIRLRVDRADLMLMSLRVVYERGAPDEYNVNERIRAGSQTQPLGLRGERRSIKQVDLVYSSMLSLKGSSKVCIDGLQ